MILPVESPPTQNYALFIDNMNRRETNDEVEWVILKQPYKENRGPDRFTAVFNRTFKGKLMPILHKFFQKTEEVGIPLNTCYEASINLIPKNKQTKTSQENYRQIYHMNMDTIILNKTPVN